MQGLTRPETISEQKLDASFEFGGVRPYNTPMIPNSFWKTLPRPFSCLAPMEDVTDTVFRRIVLSCGRPDVFFTEFTSTDGLFSVGREGVIHRLDFLPEERPIVAQIWGLNPDNYFKAGQLLTKMGFDGIDINMGCPVSKIVKKGACSALIESPAQAEELYRALREGAPTLPISIKTRLGFRKKNTEEWSEFLLGLEPDALTMHGRVAKHQSKYPADWDEIGKVVALRDQAKSPVVVIGNGDVESHAEIVEKHERYGVDGVMVGRGIFRDLSLFDPKTRSFPEMSAQEKLHLLKKHVRLYYETRPYANSYKAMKKFFKIYVSNFPGASELRCLLVEKTNSYVEFEQVLDTWLSESAISGGDIIEAPRESGGFRNADRA